MSEIPFVAQLGDAFDAAIAPAYAPATRRRRARSWRAGVVIAVLIVGGAAAAKTLLGGSSTELAATSISCMSGTSNDADGTYDVPTGGRSPEQACALVVHRPARALIACRKGVQVTVYERSGAHDQCAKLGMSPLPTGYMAANRRVHRLVVALGQLYLRSNCIAPETLAAEADAVLGRLHFTGWHARVFGEHGAGTWSGRCGMFPAGGGGASDPAEAIDTHVYPPGGHDLVVIETGPPRSMIRVVLTATHRFAAASGRRCYTLSGIQTFVRHAFAAADGGDRFPVLFASTQEQTGARMTLAKQQRFYDSGCAIVVGVYVGRNGRAILVQLEDRNSPPPTNGGAVPRSAYRPRLPSAAGAHRTTARRTGP